MNLSKFIYLLVFILPVKLCQAQDSLPNISVKDFGGKIIISWYNNYKEPVSTISIQRSYDSSKHYTTIGSVLNPQNLENGYADVKAPYNKMYYRLFISFEGGKYLFSSIKRPEKIKPKVVEKNNDSVEVQEINLFPWQIKPDSSAIKSEKELKKDSSVVEKPELIIYPSRRIFAVKESTVIIYLPDATSKKYLARFYGPSDQLLFELPKLNEQYLMLEKFNFRSIGWYRFELFESGKLVEKNKFYLGKDLKTTEKRSVNK